MPTKPISISDNVAVSATENQDIIFDGLRVRVKGTVKLRIYRGPQLDLRITLNLITLSGTDIVKTRPFIFLKGKAYIDGEDDSYEWDVDMYIEKGETLRIAATNANATYTYDYRLNLSVIFPEGGH